MSTLYGNVARSITETYDKNLFENFQKELDLFNNDPIFETALILESEGDSKLEKIKNMALKFFEKVKELISKVITFFRDKFKIAIAKFNQIIDKFRKKNYKKRIEDLERQAKSNTNESALLEATLIEEVETFKNQKIDMYRYDYEIKGLGTIKSAITGIVKKGDSFREPDNRDYFYGEDKSVVYRKDIEGAKHISNTKMSIFIDKYADNDKLFDLSDFEIGSTITLLEKEREYFNEQIKDLQNHDENAQVVNHFVGLTEKEPNVKLSDALALKYQRINGTLHLLKELSNIYWAQGINYVKNEKIIDDFLNKHELKNIKRLY